MSDLLNRLNQAGYAITKPLLTGNEANGILRLLERFHAKKERPEIHHCLNTTPGLKELLINENMKSLLGEVATGYFIVNSFYFDKTHDSHEAVSFHQNKTVYLKQKVDMYGFKHWTQKENEFAVQPPAEYSGNIVTVRIHLDDTDETNCALKVIPYSHSEANIRAATMSSFSDADAVLCPVTAGGVMLMKPLLVHTSSKPTSEKPGRVILMDLCSLELPEGMEWAEKTLI